MAYEDMNEDTYVPAISEWLKEEELKWIQRQLDILKSTGAKVYS